MSELLDAFDDAGLLDLETRAFLVEALANAEEDDWRDILEPFVSPPDQALEALAKVPGVLARSQQAIEKENAVQEKEEEEISPLADFFLKALPGGVLAASGLHTVARVARVCRAALSHASESEFWKRRAEFACVRWVLPQPVVPSVGSSAATWRDRYFSALRPRCDGIYVGECSFKRWVRLGHHMDMRKNAEALACYGGRGGCDEKMRYRRFVRLLPPDPEDGSLWAIVLQDPCPRDAALRVLIENIDVRTHTNPAKSEGIPEGAVPNASDANRLRKRICVGHYTFVPEEGRVEIRYVATDGEYHLTFSLSHGGARIFADRLTWEHYEMEQLTGPSSTATPNANNDAIADGAANGAAVEAPAAGAGAGAAGGDDRDSRLITFNLGRLPDWKGGGLVDENKDHYPQMQFRPKVELEHLG